MLQIAIIKDWLSDFVPYSIDSWIGLLGDYNQSLWPYNLLVVPLLAALIWTCRQNGAFNYRASLWLLAMCWIWSGLAFHRQYYVTLNWSATLFVWFFMLQAMLLLIWSTRHCPEASTADNQANKLHIGLLVFAIFSQPLLQLFNGHSYNELGWPGLTPDATAIVTLSVLGSRARSVLIPLVVPLLWAVLVFATSWPMDYWPGMLLLPLSVGVLFFGKYCR